MRDAIAAELSRPANYGMARTFGSTHGCDNSGSLTRTPMRIAGGAGL
jgi:hypothetical protein